MAAEEECPLDLDDVGHMRKIFKKLDTMRQEQKNCDVIISVEGKEIHANKDILCAASDYFDAMFSHDTVERKSGVVQMKEISYVAVKKCVDFIYTGKLSTNVEKCEDLLYAANLLQLNNIREKIQPFLESRLDCESFFVTRKISEKFSLGALTKHCDNFASSHLESLAKKQKFTSLDFDYVSHLLSKSDIEADLKLSIGLKWINYAPEEREGHLMEVVNLIDTNILSCTYCRQLAESEPICMKSAEFMRMIVLTLTSRIENVTGASATDVSFTQNSLILFNHDGLHTYIPERNQLQRINCSSIGLSHEDGFSTCIHDQYLYVVFFNSTHVHVLNIEHLKWHRCRDMLHNHGNDLQCVAHGGKIYVGGSYTLETLYIAEDRWKTVDVDSDSLFGSSLVVHNNRLYAIGGFDGKSLSIVTSYSLRDFSWSQETQLRCARFCSSSTVFNNKINVAGGFGENLTQFSEFEMYDSVAKIWTGLPRMLIGRSSFRLVVVSNKLFAVGGAAKKGHVIEVFDPKIGKWSEHPAPCIDGIVITATLSL